MVVIVDYGMGNLNSVLKAFKSLNIEAVLSSEHKVIANADRLILPGVGHFRNGIERLKQLGLQNLLNELVLGKKLPILGICLGMQLFTRHSEEGDIEGLGWIEGQTTRFQNLSIGDNKLPIPHMGWNTLSPMVANEILPNDPLKSYYFVHSYYVTCSYPSEVLATSFYGHQFVSAVRKDNIIGVQFHPEKSHAGGLHLLKNFHNYLPCFVQE